MGVAFVPLAISSLAEPAHSAGADAIRLVPILASAVLLAVGTMMVFPFEMTMITALGHGRLIGTYYGLYNLLSGVGILLGNLASGGAMDLARSAGVPALPWLLLLVAGGASAVAVRTLDRRGRLATPPAGQARPVPVAAMNADRLTRPSRR